MTDTYTTKLGDKWDTIALSQYGSTSYVGSLMTANSEYSDIYIFPAGITLKLPEISKNATRTSLPPWKRVL